MAYFKATDPELLGAWYKRHLGIDVKEQGGCTFHWQTTEEPNPPLRDRVELFKGDADYFQPSRAPFMINYRVHDLSALLDALREQGREVDPRTEESRYGRFGRVMDPEGNRVELWEPPSGRAAD